MAAIFAKYKESFGTGVTYSSKQCTWLISSSLPLIPHVNQEHMCPCHLFLKHTLFVLLIVPTDFKD